MSPATVKLGWFPLGHASSDDMTPGLSAAFVVDVIRHALLPVGTIVALPIGFGGDRLERIWRGYLRQRGCPPSSSTPVVPDHE